MAEALIIDSDMYGTTIMLRCRDISMIFIRENEIIDEENKDEDESTIALGFVCSGGEEVVTIVEVSEDAVNDIDFRIDFIEHFLHKLRDKKPVVTLSSIIEEYGGPVRRM
jgi:hypothetical protein